MSKVSRLLRWGLSLGAIVACLWAPAAGPAWSQDAQLDDRELGVEASKPQAADSERQARMRTIEQRLLAVQQVIRGLQSELRALKETASDLPDRATSAASAQPSQTQTARAAPAPDRTPTSYQPTSEEERAVSPEQEVPEFTPGVLRETRAVLIRPGLLEIDPRLRYEFSKRDVIDVSGVNIVEAIFVGTFRIGEVTRNRITSSLSFRYGYWRDLQFNLSVPYTWVDRKNILPDARRSVSGIPSARPSSFSPK